MESIDTQNPNIDNIESLPNANEINLAPCVIVAKDCEEFFMTMIRMLERAGVKRAEIRKALIHIYNNELGRK